MDFPHCALIRLQFVIMIFPDHTHYFWCKGAHFITVCMQSKTPYSANKIIRRLGILNLLMTSRLFDIDTNILI